MKTLKILAFSTFGLAGILAMTTLCPQARAAMPADRSTSTLKRADHRFIEKAAKSGEEEIAISRIAAERSANPDVRAFAQKMVSDHTEIGQKLADLAGTKGVVLPMKNDKENKWQKKNAKDFDKDYIEKMISDHKEAVELFQKEGEKGDDPDTVAFARKTLPTLQAHLEKASDIKKMLD